MRIKSSVDILIEDTSEYSSIDDLLEDLKQMILNSFNAKVNDLYDKYQNVQIIGVSISTDEDSDEDYEGYYTREFKKFVVDFERDETPREEKARLKMEAKAVSRKLKEKQMKEKKKKKELEEEYNYYLALKKKYENNRIDVSTKGLL